jgi:hypothetical protein
VGELREGGRNAPAFERGQLAQLDPVKAIIAKRAQERVLLESRAKRLRVKRADAPPQARAPFTATAITSTRIPRDEEWANKCKIIIINRNRGWQHKTSRITHYLSSGKSGFMGRALANAQ